MKAKKALIVFLLIMILSGCSTVCNLTINEDLSVDMEIDNTEIVSNIEIGDIEEGTNVKEMLHNQNQSTLNYYKKMFPEFVYDLIETDTVFTGKVSRKFDSIMEFKNSDFLKQAFSNVVVTNSNGKVVVNLANINKEYLYAVLYDNQPISIMIKLPYVVSYNNATSFDAVNNVYVWNINNDTQSINMEFDANQKYEYKVSKQKNNRQVFYIVISGIALVAIVITLIVNKKKMK